MKHLADVLYARLGYLAIVQLANLTGAEFEELQRELLEKIHAAINEVPGE